MFQAFTTDVNNLDLDQLSWLLLKHGDSGGDADFVGDLDDLPSGYLT